MQDIFAADDLIALSKTIATLRVGDVFQGINKVNLRGSDTKTTSKITARNTINTPILNHFHPNATHGKRKYLYFDYIPVATDRYEWYSCGVTADGIFLTKSDYPHPDKFGGNGWLEVNRWVSDFCAPFFVATSKNDRFFVTDVGHVYTLPPAVHGPPERTPARLRKVWLGLPPVDALIHDADNSKWYAFTKDSYFELADPIRPKPHAIRVQRPKTAEESLTTAAACGRVIRGLPEPKGK